MLIITQRSALDCKGIVPESFSADLERSEVERSQIWLAAAARLVAAA